MARAPCASAPASEHAQRFGRHVAPVAHKHQATGCAAHAALSSVGAALVRTLPREASHAIQAPSKLSIMKGSPSSRFTMIVIGPQQPMTQHFGGTLVLIAMASCP